ncbi:hypothetical protein H7X46_14200 [Pseudonocardia sp. C8]|uniref:hypothetical protein n=1 Tax=Pseudonocardia sp. C8 TaxID=2762759 RepID=UPI00164311E6|nr:hypothetical protein [Pseudonocardia sp. C8]MBC3192213.1 hypothetical protein [Pseudonocardia sp. C8]
MADAHPEDAEEGPDRGGETPDRHDDPARDARRRDGELEEEPEHGSDSAASQTLRRTAGPEGSDSVDRM